MLDATQIYDGTLTTSGVTGVAITTTRVSTNVLDMLTGRDIGNGDALYLNVIATAAFTTADAATLTIQYEVCDTDNGTYLPLIRTPIYAASNLTLGQRLASYVIPPNQLNNATNGVLKVPGRYTRLTYTVGTGTFSAGSVAAYLTARPDRNCLYIYPKNYVAYVDPDQIAV